jgi:chorismate lyase/3-hydroxybenzoate synthase
LSRLTIGISDVPDLSDARFESLVTAAYEVLASELARQRRYPVRFWNFIPGIRAAMPSAPERYIVFNAGRFHAFEAWFGGAFRRAVPTASAVGIRGRVLFIHCLAADNPGRAVENPRQRPAYMYSARYGPLPPSFARATVVGPTHSARVLVGGTASVRGEDTVHTGDIGRQTRETLDNLAALVAAACGAQLEEGRVSWEWLSRFRSLRVHVLRPDDGRYAEEAIRSHFPRLESLELVHAELCRGDLLLEIEGVADAAS